jgi:hypothetical protein
MPTDPKKPEREPSQKIDPQAAGRGGSLRDMKTLEDEVAEASDESFPASDPPSFNRTTANPSLRDRTPRK